MSRKKGERLPEIAGVSTLLEAAMWFNYDRVVEMNNRQIMAAFGVPPEMLDGTPSSHGASLRMFRERYFGKGNT